MKKSIICFLILSILSSCTNQPKCDSDEAIQLAKNLIKQGLKSNGGSLALAELGMGDENTIDEFVDENIELKSVRTTEKDDELKTCSCASQITFKFSDDFKEKMKEKGKENLSVSAINDMINEQIEYNYNLQRIEKEKNLYIEGIVPIKELRAVLISHIMFAHKKESETENNIKPKQDEYFAIVKKDIAPIYRTKNVDVKTDYIFHKGDTIRFIREARDGWILFEHTADNEKVKRDGYCKQEDLTILKR
jgi:hypothetical protein